jgi:hypothetical protein
MDMDSLWVVKRQFCEFCAQPCGGPLPAEQTGPICYWSCKSCQIAYETYFTGRLQKLMFDTRFRDKQYSLQLWYNVEETRIIRYPDNLGDTIVEVVAFPFLIQGITPQNIRDKLATYVTFS